MTLAVAIALVLSAALQTTPADRAHAESLARAGQTVEAIGLFKHIVEANPADLAARLWVARLALRLGRTAEAEAEFRAVLREDPHDIDARIGLAMVLTRAGAWSDAINILEGAKKDAGDNADLFSALARAYRRGGDDRRALEYFAQARTLAPDDPDVVLGYEAAARAYGHWIAAEAYGQAGAPGIDAGSGSLTANVRITSRVHLEGSGRLQRRSDYSDATAGGGVTWRAARNATLAVHALGGPDNVALPTSDLAGDVIRYAGAFEVGGQLRRLSFSSVDVVAASPAFAWNPTDRWRLDLRYTFSRTSFDQTGSTSNDHSIMVRETWQGWPRTAIQATYAYGIESFEDLTVDRLASLGGATVALGVRLDIVSLTRLTTTWDHQWRSNHTSINRFTVSLVQIFP